MTTAPMRADARWTCIVPPQECVRTSKHSHAAGPVRRTDVARIQETINASIIA